MWFVPVCQNDSKNPETAIYAVYAHVDGAKFFVGLFSASDHVQEKIIPNLNGDRKL